jgi:hypothetical protein
MCAYVKPMRPMCLMKSDVPLCVAKGFAGGTQADSRASKIIELAE